METNTNQSQGPLKVISWQKGSSILTLQVGLFTLMKLPGKLLNVLHCACVDVFSGLWMSFLSVRYFPGAPKCIDYTQSKTDCPHCSRHLHKSVLWVTGSTTRLTTLFCINLHMALLVLPLPSGKKVVALASRLRPGIRLWLNADRAQGPASTVQEAWAGYTGHPSDEVNLPQFKKHLVITSTEEIGL